MFSFIMIHSLRLLLRDQAEMKRTRGSFLRDGDPAYDGHERESLEREHIEKATKCDHGPG